MQAQLTIAALCALAAPALAAPGAVATSSTATVTAPLATRTSSTIAALTDDAVAETIEVVDRRVEHPFDAHAARVLSGRRLAELGVTNLAEALEHIPAAFVRTAGRGGYQVDIRGARKGSLLVLVDGMPISDPFFGNFDVASIPATDISEIRVSNAPASPIDGPGGNGGVVEVITRSAAGRTRAFARASAGTTPGGRAAISAKGELGGGFAVRLSATGSVDARTFEVQPRDGPLGTIPQSGRGVHAGALVERVGEKGRIGLDVSAGTQTYVVPPSEDEGANLTVIDGEPVLRASLLGEYRPDEDVRLSLRAFAQSLSRESHLYRNADLSADGALAQVDASRYGALARADWATTDDLTLIASAAVVSERGGETGDSGDGAAGEVSVLQAAASAGWALVDWLSVDGAAGAAIPLSSGASPWPEARLSVELTTEHVDLTLIGARKGRVPTLRERFQPITGNPAIGPELSTYAEAMLVLKPVDFAALTTSGWIRNIEGVIKIPLGGNQLDNVGDLLTGGVDVQLDLAFFARALELRVAYQLQGQTGESPYDFFPTHRGEVTVNGRLGKSVGVWARGKYLGDRIDQGESLGELITFDGGGWYRVSTLRFLARVENVFDAQWLAHAGVPGFGRAFWLGLEVETPP